MYRNQIFLAAVVVALLFGTTIGCHPAPPLPTASTPSDPVDQETKAMPVPRP